MPCARCSFLLRGRPLIDATIAAVEADPGFRSVVVDHRCVVNVVNHCDVHVIYGAIVEKSPIIPAPAFVSMAKITESVVDSAVKTYQRAPIPIVEKETAILPIPIARGP